MRVSPPAAAVAEAKRKEEERKRKESEDKKKQEEARAAAAAIPAAAAAAAAAAGDVHCVCVHVIRTIVCRVTNVYVFHHPQQPLQSNSVSVKRSRVVPRHSIMLALPSRLSGGSFCSVFLCNVRTVDLDRVSAFRL